MVELIFSMHISDGINHIYSKSFIILWGVPNIEGINKNIARFL